MKKPAKERRLGQPGQLVRDAAPPLCIAAAASVTYRDAQPAASSSAWLRITKKKKKSKNAWEAATVAQSDA